MYGTILFNGSTALIIINENKQHYTIKLKIVYSPGSCLVLLSLFKLKITLSLVVNRNSKN